jgi:general stress protein 26
MDEESSEIRFLTRAGSHKTEEISNDARVNLVFVEDGDTGYMSVVGTARLSQDRDLIRSLWSPAAQAWLPDGPDGPDVALIRVRALRAEIWDLKSFSMASYWDMAKAVSSGRAPDAGGHHEVRL